MTAQELRLELLQCALDRVGLLQHVDAVRAVFDHLPDALDMPLDGRESRVEDLLLCRHRYLFPTAALARGPSYCTPSPPGGMALWVANSRAWPVPRCRSSTTNVTVMSATTAPTARHSTP